MEVMKVLSYSPFCLLFYLLFPLLLSSATLGKLSAQVRVIGKTAQLQADYAQGVSGHGGALLHTEAGGAVLVVVGGCNFPDVPAREGGAKRYYAEVYGTAYHEGQRIKSWQLLGRMLQPLAYAAYQSYNNALIVAGGKTAEGDISQVYSLSLSAEGRLQQRRLADLPKPRSGMASAVLGSRLYLIGGAVEGRLSCSVISLDLSDPSAQWQDEAPYPSPSPYLKILACAVKASAQEGQEQEQEQGQETQKGYIYAFGSYRHSESDSLAVCTDMRIMKYEPSRGSWTQSIEQDPALGFEGYTFGGGCIYADPLEGSITLLGGVHPEVFLPALQREQDMRIAQRYSQQDKLSKLRNEARAYLSASVSAYRFCPKLFFYSAELGAMGAIAQSTHSSRHLAKADAALVEIKAGHYLLIGGETKPGVRTADIVY